MRVLFIGDIVGEPGRKAVAKWLPVLREELDLDFVVANAENSSGGLGAQPETFEELRGYGCDAFTMGNHTWRKKALIETIDAMEDVVRPANYPVGTPGRGSAIVTAKNGKTLGVVNVIGRVYMEAFNCPFEAARAEAERLREDTPIVIVDMHAEATSEKIALGWYLDGRCSAVVGTHTHVQTADNRLLHEGTAYITDIGMTGPRDSVIGTDRDKVIRKFVTGMPTPFTVAKGGDRMLNAVVMDIDDETGRASTIERVFRCDSQHDGEAA